MNSNRLVRVISVYVAAEYLGSFYCELHHNSAYQNQVARELWGINARPLFSYIGHFNSL